MDLKYLFLAHFLEFFLTVLWYILLMELLASGTNEALRLDALLCCKMRKTAVVALLLSTVKLNTDVEVLKEHLLGVYSTSTL